MMPTKEGFYWGKWRIKADDTYLCRVCGKTSPANEDVNEPPGDEWEVMHVVENGDDPTDDEFLMVMVPGVSSWQPLENFVWGEAVSRLKTAQASEAIEK